MEDAGGLQQQHCCKLDLWGYPVHTSSDACISHINSHYQQILAYGADRKIILKAIEADGSCVLAHALCAARALSGHPAKAASHLAAAKFALMEATGYEKLVFETVEALVEGQNEVALDLHFKLLVKFPRDLVSLKRFQVLCFKMGKPDEALKAALQVQTANYEVAYIYGMLAFPLVEVHRMNDAEVAARQGLEIEPRDAWAQHALCHVLHHQCRFSEAIAFMEENSYSWNNCCSFMYIHNWWHVALCYLEGGCSCTLDSVLFIYDNYIWNAEYQDMDGGVEACIAGLGLLLRLHLRGNQAVVDSRITKAITYLCNTSSWNKEWLLDLLVVWALAHSGHQRKADCLLKNLQNRVEEMKPNKQKPMLIAIKLAAGLCQYGNGNYKEAFYSLGSDFDVQKMKSVGASNEQLDVFEELWCVVSLRSGHLLEVSRVLEQWAIQRCRCSFTWRLMEELYSKLEVPEKAMAAGGRANSLEMAFQQEIESRRQRTLEMPICTKA
eukprot:c23829_g1_i1 orf=81-1568(+)